MIIIARKPISKNIRFEVFKRDSFTCQYCGRMSPDVVLQVDHINPVKNGGDNDILNLITSCSDCNNGKGSKKLTDKQEIKKQQEQLKQLSQKKEQLALMVKWREGLLNLEEDELLIAENELLKHDQYKLSEHGKQRMRELIKKFSLIAVLEAISIAYPRYNKDKSNESWNIAFNKLGGICYNKIKEKKDPLFTYRNKAYNIFKNKLPIYNEARLRNMIKKFIVDEESYEKFLEIINESKNWTVFFETIESIEV